MDYLKKFDEIIKLLEKHNYIDYVDRVTLLTNTASTGSELIMSVTHELLQIVNQDIELKVLIGEETAELREFCWSIGLRVR